MKAKQQIAQNPLAVAAKITGHSEFSVRKWIHKGKRDMDGNVHKLPYSKFSESDVRILLSDLVAFGKVSFWGV